MISKCFVLLLCLWKKFADVVLPRALIVDVLVGRNDSYARVLREYVVADALDKTVSMDRSLDAKKSFSR